MAYVPEWERLADARKRVMAAGLSKGEAERDLCAAMSDGKIKVRPFFELVKRTILDHQIAKRDRRKIFDFVRDLQEGVHPYPEPWDDFRAFSTKGVTPRQLDWRQSRFRNVWHVPIHPEKAPMDWNVSVELASADVTRALITDTRTQQAATAPPESTTRKTRPPAGRERARPQREAAMEALKAIYVKGIPSQSTVPNKALCAKVNEYQKDKRLSEIRPDSILRAAGRRKDG
jgi:hypothetical protein